MNKHHTRWGGHGGGKPCGEGEEAGNEAEVWTKPPTSVWGYPTLVGMAVCPHSVTPMNPIRTTYRTHTV